MGTNAISLHGTAFVPPAAFFRLRPVFSGLHHKPKQTHGKRQIA
jgi:hypothetical protein